MNHPSLILGALGGALLCASALAALAPGAPAPQFTAQASQNGKAFRYSLRSELRHGPVVVYFYPSAYTRGCDIEAHTFSSEIAQFRAAGASVVGVSLDSIERLKDFSKDPNFCAGNFPVASDADGHIARSYELKITALPGGAQDVRGQQINHDMAERTTFIVRSDGTIAATISGAAPADNVARSLTAVQGLSGGK